MDNPSQETLEKWHKDPNNWKWGLFYYNKEDKRLLAPKKIKWMGLTINFANRNSVFLFVLIMGLAIAMIILMPSGK